LESYILNDREGEERIILKQILALSLLIRQLNVCTVLKIIFFSVFLLLFVLIPNHF
jgi:hypothetical protein